MSILSERRPGRRPGTRRRRRHASAPRAPLRRLLRDPVAVVSPGLAAPGRRPRRARPAAHLGQPHRVADHRRAGPDGRRPPARHRRRRPRRARAAAVRRPGPACIGGAHRRRGRPRCSGCRPGMVAGYYRGRFDAVASWVANLLMALPAIIVLLVVLAPVRPQHRARRWRSSACSSRPASSAWCARRCIGGARGAVRRRGPGLRPGRRAGSCAGTSCPSCIAPTVIQASQLLGIAIVVQAGPGVPRPGLGEPGELGRDAQRRLPEHLHRAPAAALAGPGDRPDRHRVQPARQRAARRARRRRAGSPAAPAPSSGARPGGGAADAPPAARSRPADALLALRGPARAPTRRPTAARPRSSTGCRSPSGAARCSAWSASPGRARPRRPSPSSGCCPRRRARRPAHLTFDGSDLQRPVRGASATGCAGGGSATSRRSRCPTWTPRSASAAS